MEEKEKIDRIIEIMKEFENKLWRNPTHETYQKLIKKIEAVK